MKKPFLLRLPLRIAKMPCLKRRIWIKYLEYHNLNFMDTDTPWYENVEKIRKHQKFFKEIKYTFDAEKCGSFEHETRYYISPNIAIANFFYTEGDVGTYKETFKEIGFALEFYKRKDKHVTLSKTWIDYLHGKATTYSLNQKPSKGAELNLECSRCFAKLGGHDIDSLKYQNCSICSRIEAISYNEDYLFNSIEDKLLENINKLEKKLQSKNIDEAGKRDNLYESLYYAYVLRCKNQMSRNTPSTDILDNSIKNAEKFRNLMKNGDTKDSSNFIIPLYKAHLFRLKDFPNETNRELAIKEYKISLEKIQGKNIAYYCLLRLPDIVNQQISSYTGLEVLQENKEYMQKISQNIKNIKIFSRCCVFMHLIFCSLYFLSIVHCITLLKDNQSDMSYKFLTLIFLLKECFSIPPFFLKTLLTLIVFSIFMFPLYISYCISNKIQHGLLLEKKESLDEKTKLYIKEKINLISSIFFTVLTTGIVTIISLVYSQ